MKYITPYFQFKDRCGQHCIVLVTIDKPDIDHDWECIPMYTIRFDDGFETDAWPEELFEDNYTGSTEFWTQEAFNKYGVHK